MDKLKKIKIQLFNWSKHNNLGDDMMAKVLLDYFSKVPEFEVENVGENINNNADFYIMGGGTIITKGSLFMKHCIPEKTICISVGVDYNYKGEHKEKLLRMKRIYVRDIFTYESLKKYGINSVLSVDLGLFLYKLNELKNKEIINEEIIKPKIMANFIFSMTWPTLEYFKKMTELRYAVNILERDNDVKYYALSPVEDMNTEPRSILYKNAETLIEDMSECSLIITTRLHALVLAYISGCLNIIPIIYDPKCSHFLERMSTITKSDAKNMIDKHLLEIKEILLNE